MACPVRLLADDAADVGLRLLEQISSAHDGDSECSRWRERRAAAVTVGEIVRSDERLEAVAVAVAIRDGSGSFQSGGFFGRFFDELRYHNETNHSARYDMKEGKRKESRLTISSPMLFFLRLKPSFLPTKPPAVPTPFPTKPTPPATPCPASDPT
jgi:hypothetical protein